MKGRSLTESVQAYFHLVISPLLSASLCALISLLCFTNTPQNATDSPSSRSELPLSQIFSFSAADAAPRPKKDKKRQRPTKQSITKKSKRPKPKLRKNSSKKQRRRTLKDEPDLNLKSLKAAFNRSLSKDSLSEAKVGYIVRDLKSGDTLLEYHADHMFHPASNTKLATTAAAYHVLGPEERFVTRWYIDEAHHLSDQKLGKGLTLYWRASGDPKFLPEHMREIAKKIAQHLKKDKPSSKALSISKLVIDDKDFTDQYLAPGFDQKPEDDSSYRAPNGGIGYAFNRFRASFSPNSKLNAPPHLSLDPQIPYFTINNQAITNKKGKEKLQFKAVESEKNQRMRLELGGSIPLRHKRVSISRRVGNPLIYAGQGLLGELKRLGINVSMKVQRGEVPSKLEAIVVHKSAPVSELIRDINVYSNNYMAEQLLLAMGLKVKNFGGWSQGQLVVKSYLDAIVGLSGYQYVNGSGLFGETSFSPRMLSEVLVRVDKESNGHFRSFLPVAGKEGTLKKRLKDLPRGDFRAKTGTLDKVSTLCGYLKTRAQQELVLCLFMNDYKVKTWAIRSIQDELVSYLWLYKAV